MVFNPEDFQVSIYLRYQSSYSNCLALPEVKKAVDKATNMFLVPKKHLYLHELFFCFFSLFVLPTEHPKG